MRAPTGAAHPHRFGSDAIGLALLLASACGDDGDADTGDSEPGSSSAPMTSSATETAGATDSGPTSAPTSGSGDETGTDDATGGSGNVGPNFGLLTFTLYPADASGSPEQLGMAGAWRTEAFTTDDFYAVRSLGLFFPLAPAEPDTLVLHDPAVYEWGKVEAWVALGNGVRLASPGGDALACLQLVEASFPVYLSDGADFFDPACAPDPTRWLPGTKYDLEAYGGEDFDDQLRKGAVTTPTALTVTAPAIDEFDFPLEKAKGLTVTWTADGGADDRVVIRLWDQFNKQIVVHAADDGSHEIAGADLDKLAAGPATLTVAREHLSELGLAAGELRVLARHETWAYPDLF